MWGGVCACVCAQSSAVCACASMFSADEEHVHSVLSSPTQEERTDWPKTSR